MQLVVQSRKTGYWKIIASQGEQLIIKNRFSEDFNCWYDYAEKESRTGRATNYVIKEIDYIITAIDMGVNTLNAKIDNENYRI